MLYRAMNERAKHDTAQSLDRSWKDTECIKAQGKIDLYPKYGPNGQNRK